MRNSQQGILMRRILHPLLGDLRSLGSDERNLPEAKAPSGPSERARASHWAVVREVLIKEPTLRTFPKKFALTLTLSPVEREPDGARGASRPTHPQHSTLNPQLILTYAI